MEKFEKDINKDLNFDFVELVTIIQSLDFSIENNNMNKDGKKEMKNIKNKIQKEFDKRGIR